MGLPLVVNVHDGESIRVTPGTAAAVLEALRSHAGEGSLFKKGRILVAASSQEELSDADGPFEFERKQGPSHACMSPNGAHWPLCMAPGASSLGRCMCQHCHPAIMHDAWLCTMHAPIKRSRMAASHAAVAPVCLAFALLLLLFGRPPCPALLQGFPLSLP